MTAHPKAKPTPLRIVMDRDCPGCGWPEVRVVHPSREPDESSFYECARRTSCGWRNVGYWEGAAR